MPEERQRERDGEQASKPSYDDYTRPPEAVQGALPELAPAAEQREPARRTRELPLDRAEAIVGAGMLSAAGLIDFLLGEPRFPTVVCAVTGLCLLAGVRYALVRSLRPPPPKLEPRTLYERFCTAMINYGLVLSISGLLWQLPWTWLLDTSSPAATGIPAGMVLLFFGVILRVLGEDLKEKPPRREEGPPPGAQPPQGR